jgi:hypothetical protein
MVKVEAKIDNLLQAMENEPKTLAWKIRARVGTSRQWYRDVDELNRVAF